MTRVANALTFDTSPRAIELSRMEMCERCGTAAATIHLSRVFHSSTGTTSGTVQHYCPACYALEHKTPLPNIDAPAINPSTLLASLYQEHPRFSHEAYFFVLNALSKSLKRRNLLAHAHITVRQLVETATLLAREQHGDEARIKLASWGLNSASDIGDVIFLLCSKGMLGRSLHDQRSDFDDLPFLDESSG